MDGIVALWLAGWTPDQTVRAGELAGHGCFVVFIEQDI